MESRGVSVLTLLIALGGVVSMTGGAFAAQCGRAAWYDLGGQTASGERSDGSALAAAHRTLPFGTRVRVENLSNGREVVVRINDRGPFVGGRVIDVTRAAAEKLGMIQSGTAKVRVSVVDGGAKLDGACDDPAPRVLTADAVAAGATRAKPKPEPAEAAAPPADTRTTAAKAPAEEPGTVAATPSPNEAKPVQRNSGKVLVATAFYDEGTGDSDAAPVRSKAAAPDAAAFADEPQVEDLEDAKVVASLVDIPLPRPRPAVFDNAAPVFNQTLALRFLDAFAPGESRLDLNSALGYAPIAPTVPRGAVITE